MVGRPTRLSRGYDEATKLETVLTTKMETVVSDDRTLTLKFRQGQKYLKSIPLGPAAIAPIETGVGVLPLWARTVGKSVVVLNNRQVMTIPIPQDVLRIPAENAEPRLMPSRIRMIVPNDRTTVFEHSVSIPNDDLTVELANPVNGMQLNSNSLQLGFNGHALREHYVAMFRKSHGDSEIKIENAIKTAHERQKWITDELDDYSGTGVFVPHPVLLRLRNKATDILDTLSYAVLIELPVKEIRSGFSKTEAEAASENPEPTGAGSR